MFDSYEQFFVTMKQRVMTDFGAHFDTSRLDHLSLSLSRTKSRMNSSGDQYRSRTAKVPAYYNPNTHTVHLNLNILEHASFNLIENVYYHELMHAASHHARIAHDNQKVLKSGLKIQVWDENDQQRTLHRSLNEGVTQYFANLESANGAAYRREVQVIGKLIQRIGLNEIRAAYFGPAIDQLERRMHVSIGEGAFEELSELVDAKEYESAEALLSR